MTRKQNTRPYAVYVVEGEGQAAFWTKIGAAWAHKDSEGFSITLSAMPVKGRIVVRKPKANKEAGR